LLRQFYKICVLISVAGSLQAITFSWDVASEILSSLNLSSILQSAFSQLDFNVVSVISFFRIPEAINLILSAHVTRQVMTFIGV
jgi:hypothetical protein